MFQHLVAQLEALGVEAVEGTSVELVPQNARARPLAVADDRGEVENLTLEISDLARPCVGTGKLRVVESIPKRRSNRTRGAHASKGWNGSRKQ